MAYTPVPQNNLQSSPILPQLQNIYLNTRGLDQLMKKFVFQQVCEQKTLPKNSGRQIQFYRWSLLQEKTTPKYPEGAVGTSSSLPPAATVSLTVSQYTDYITLSDMLLATAPLGVFAEMGDSLSYQAAITVDTITRTVIDNEASSANVAMLGANLRVEDLRQMSMLMQGRDIRPMSDGNYFVVLHPYVAFDLVNDPAAGGLLDIFKYTEPGKSGQISMEDRGIVSTVAMSRVVMNTNVATIAGSPNKWRVYSFGRGGVGSVDLSGMGPSKIYDPMNQKFEIKQWRRGNDAVGWDPEGVLGGGVSYNFVFGVVVLQGPTGIGGQYRFRTMDAPSSIVA